jgi:hypothetical protein
MTIADLRIKHNMPASTKSTAVLNKALRIEIPGGAEVLNALTRAHEMQHGRNPPDAALQFIIDQLREARDKMCAGITG